MVDKKNKEYMQLYMHSDKTDKNKSKYDTEEKIKKSWKISYLLIFTEIYDIGKFTITFIVQS